MENVLYVLNKRLYIYIYIKWEYLIKFFDISLQPWKQK
jgi:hypothetical protein